MTRSASEGLFLLHGRRDRKSYLKLNLAFGSSALTAWFLILLMNSEQTDVSMNAATWLVFTTSAGVSPIFSMFPVVLLFQLILVLCLCAMAVAAATTTAQRLRDIGYSGLFATGMLVPFFGGVIWTVALLMPGERGPNKFGADPRGLKK